MTDQYACLGFVKELEFTTDDGDFLVRFPQKDSWTLKGRKNTTVLIAINKRELFLLPWQSVKKAPMSRYQKEAKRLYKSWSGYQIDQAFKLNIPKSKTNLIDLGLVTRIEYTSDKLERTGDRQGKFHLYEHGFLKPPSIFGNNDNAPTHWVIRSNKTLVTSHGLIG